MFCSLLWYKNFRAANCTSVCGDLPMPGITDHPCLLEQLLLVIFLKKQLRAIAVDIEILQSICRTHVARL